MPDTPAPTPGDPPPGGDPPTPPPDPPGGDPPPSSTAKPSEAELVAALEEARKDARTAQSKLSRLEKEHMTEQEKAIELAKKQGRDEALLTAGRRLAAAEFRAAAAGKLADPAALLDMIDLGKYVGEDGEPDSKGIAAFVDKLVATMPAPTNGRVPAGARGTGKEGGNSDQWLRDSIR